MGNDYSRRKFIKNAVMMTGAASAAATNPFGNKVNAQTPTKLPNILWLTCEDMGPHLGCFGDKDSETPALDALALAGVKYTNACCVAGVCAPSRAGIITAMYPSSIGASHMRVRDSTPQEDFLHGFPFYLREAGYYCSNNSKTDYQLAVSETEPWDESGNEAHWNKRPNGKNFFAVFNYFETHESRYQLPPSRVREIASYPPYYPDTERAKGLWTEYYNKIKGMDAWAKERIDELKKVGLYEETIIVFFSDHGVGLPRAKRWVYNAGIQVPMIIRIPEKFRVAKQGIPNSTSTDLVSMIDMGPTTLNLAGVPIPSHFQGIPFLGENLPPKRTHLFAARDRIDNRYDFVRSVRDQRFIYIKNFTPWKPYAQHIEYCEKGAMMQEIRIAHDKGTLSEAGELFMAAHRPEEEFYDLQTDPHEINNLASSPEHSSRIIDMRKRLEGWMTEIRDVGCVPEWIMISRARTDGSIWRSMRRGRSNPLNRYLPVVNLLSEGDEALDELGILLDDPDPVVRYWAAIGVGNIWDDNASYETRLSEMLSDPEEYVRQASARALCFMGKNVSSALDILGAALKADEMPVALHAGNIVDDLGSIAKPLESTIRSLLEAHEYIGQINRRTLETINDPSTYPVIRKTMEVSR